MKGIIRAIILISIISGLAVNTESAEPKMAPYVAWKLLQPLGLREDAPIDTLLYNYYQNAVPSAISPAFATTGNQASAGEEMIYLDREPMSRFFLHDAKRFWLPSENKARFYNTPIPMSLVSYNTGGGREIAQDYFKFMFTGNATPRLQIGALVDYPYSKGSYNYQAAKGFTWGLSASYLGERYELQTYYNAFNFVNKENGGITDDLWILDTEKVNGGVEHVDPKVIPTNLTASHNRIKGKQFYMNHRYKVGFWKETYDSIHTDSVIHRELVPVSSFIWTFAYDSGTHRFTNTKSNEEDFWQNHYIQADGTRDLTSYSSMRNTLGVSLLEGFNKYAKAGLAAFITHELRKYNQTIDTIPFSGPDRPAGLTPYPLGSKLTPKITQNLLWAGAQLTKQQGSILNYRATVQLGLVGAAAGEIKADGEISTHLRLLGDTVTLKGYGRFSNTTAPYLMNNYVSNHFIWKNDFGKTRRIRFGGKLDIPHTSTKAEVGVENVQNLIYFNSDGLPVQHTGNVQVFSVRAHQDFRWRALNWRNTLVYQTSTDESVIPLPKFAVYSNLYLQFKLARVLDVQLGVDLDYYTRYYAPSYQPATMAFCNQKEIKCGNYPFMNAYINMKLSRARFYILFSHVNQGIIGGNDYFSIPHYPLNPRRFQMGVSVNFAN
ncbi:MAG: putative porin [Duncaniella sp.]|nr:putative porin [Duncaniella sp.]